MEYTAIAEWLNTTFAGFDGAILGFMNTLALRADGFLTPLMKAITFLGEKGIFFFLLAIGFMCFSKTRKMGVCIFGAVCCGALITNIILKDLVARPRPFEAMSLYKSYWDFLGSPAESGFSFPSGHVTAATAGMAALCFTRGKKMVLPGVLVVFLMCVSRTYLMAHFPSDVLFAAVIGLFSAFIAYLITRAIFIYLEDNDDFPFCATLLYFDLPLKLPKLSAAGALLPRGRRESGRTRDSRGAHGAEKRERAGRDSSARSSAHAAGAPAAKSAASDWSRRWESYRSAKNAGDTAASDPAADAVSDRASVRASGEDADMKLAQPRAKAPVTAEAPVAAESPASAADFSVDGIDWARLGLSFPEEDTDAAPEAETPVIPRSARRAAARGGYRGRHEK